MWPAFHLPGTGATIATYHLLHVVGWATFFLVGTTLTRSRPDLRRHWWWLLLGFAVCDTAGARLVFRIVSGWGGPGFAAAPLLFAAWTGLYVLLRRVAAYPLMDAWAVAFSAAHVFEKGACLAAGCCFGRPTASPLGVALHAAHGDPTRFYPLPLYEATLHLLTALALGCLYDYGRLKGRLILVLGVSYGIWRSLIDPMRIGQASSFLGGPLTSIQVACLMAIAFAVAYFLLDWAGQYRAQSGRRRRA